MIYSITEENIRIVARFMACNKPEWWDEEGAMEQLSGGTGWYAGESVDEPRGWLLCRRLDGYRTAEIECLGWHDGTCCVIGPALQPLVETAERWAAGRGYANLRFTIGSRGFSCHGRALGAPWQELRDLAATDRPEYSWFLSMGYRQSGMLPDIYGKGYHGILLVKVLTQIIAAGSTGCGPI